MKQLTSILHRIDHKGYKAYHDIKGAHTFGKYTLHIDHVQADPYASPSRIRVSAPVDKLSFTKDMYTDHWRYIGFTDYLARVVNRMIQKHQANKGIFIDAPSQEILERSAVVIHKGQLEVRLSVQLPARGRSILAKEAIQRLTVQLPKIMQSAVDDMDIDQLHEHLRLCDDQHALRQFVAKEDGLVFIRDGAILPRLSGISKQPLQSDHTKRFMSPKELEAYANLPHAGNVRGMLIKRGVTVIVGGGYHGKSTLLEAIEQGVYNHIAGDGREYIATDDTAMKIRAEDGRSVSGVDIGMFIGNLPNDKSTRSFSTTNASGSTSQATNIIEAREVGTTLLLIDEDTSATNFMIRDQRMQQLVAKEKEPITPFIDRVRYLYEEEGISTIVVVGGSGDYLEVADTVIMLDEYEVTDVTDRAKQIASEGTTRQAVMPDDVTHSTKKRMPKKAGWNAQKGKKEKVGAKGTDTILFGRETIDLSNVEQIVDDSQTRAIAEILRVLTKHHMDGNTSINELLERYEQATTAGIEQVSSFYGQHPGDLARPRKMEIAAA
ncbi:isopentenyl-diphosphate delta-isomerase [Geomicrobium sp. JCM 19037]|uniref:ABC-ATPase domain-containing protein n=1 Tax=Geomicrobium sp. JCM 19037 TaxID=1460634 RepID=UPI00045F12B1|nr:ABC-ATPase domain-containing protein [Geomicrobium sp. JCM 19037]GAK01984.1 isopentenyl-diphosphate delta-isomerase [Geomicrobium sp. JCM 19037]